MSDAPHSPSRLLDDLPAIFNDPAQPFLGQFLLAFEAVLLGRTDPVTASYPNQQVTPLVDGGFAGLEGQIAALSRIFDPQQTPDSFLPWLASWTAFALRADLTTAQQRNFVAQVLPLYRWRGTKRYLQELLQIFVIGVPTITELSGADLQVGVHSTLGSDTYVGGGIAHFFRVTLALPRSDIVKTDDSGTSLDLARRDRQIEIAHALIEQAKPAHTAYELNIVYPSMQIGDYSTVGVDTLIGSAMSDTSTTETT